MTKKQMSLFVWAVAVFGMSPVWAATNIGARAASSADLSSGPAVRTRSDVDYSKYQTRTTKTTYTSTDGGNMYYTQPTRRSDLYKQYDNAQAGNKTTTTTTTRNVRTTRAETVRSELKRKYYLTHPFFQPLKGKFGSVTDLAYTTNSYDFTLNQTVATPIDGTYPLTGIAGKWDMDRITLKEDFSYGITDQIAITGLLQYDSSEYTFDWGDGDKSKEKDNGLNILGLGFQWRFVDNNDWIARFAAQYQYQKDVANSVVADLKAGYKVTRATIYGVGRVRYIDFDGNTYGNAVSNGDAMMYLAYETDVSSTFSWGLGAGVFSVLDEDWTLNVEAEFTNLKWHNTATIMGAIGWQPGDWFALNLYAMTSFYDSADDKNVAMYWYEPDAGFNYLQRIGAAKLDNYSETTVGITATLYF